MNAKKNALRLVAEGFRVLPIVKGEKRPALTTWEDLKKAEQSQSTEIVDTYPWKDAREDALGIVTGLPTSSGSAVVVAIDLDKVRNPQVLDKVLHALGLPIDYTGAEKTPNGFHVWTYVSGSIGVEKYKVSGDRFDGIEVRGLGGQTVAYSPFLGVLSTGSLAVVSESSLRALIRKFVRDVRTHPGAAVLPCRGDGFDRVVRYLSGEVPVGSRHDETVAVASILREMGVERPESGLAILRTGFDRLPQGPDLYTKREFERDVRDAWNYRRASSGLLVPRGSTLRVWTPGELRTMEVPETKFLLRNFLLDRGLVFLSGETGAGKSMLSLTLALDISGRDRERFLDFPIEKRGAVIYVDIENPAEEIRRRIGVMERNVSEGFVLVTPREGVAPGLDEILGSIDQVRREREVVAIFVDGVYLAGRGRDESSQKEVLELLLPIQTLTRDSPVVLWVPLHRKKGNRDLRADVEDIHGSNVFGRIASQAFSLRRNRGSNARPMEKVLRMTKVRSFSDEGIAKAYLLETRPGPNPELHFVRVIDEDETLQRAPGSSETKKSDFDIVGLISSRFKGKATRKELLDATRDFLSRSTLDRILDEAVARKEVERGSGGYTVPVTMFRDR